MTMGQQKDRQGDLMVGWAEMPRSPGHVFYDRLQSVLIEGGFDGFAEAACRSYYAARLGAPSVPPGRYFRMHLVGYFEGIVRQRQRGAHSHILGLVFVLSRVSQHILQQLSSGFLVFSHISVSFHGWFHGVRAYPQR